MSGEPRRFSAQMTSAERFIGVDVSAKRGCAIAALDERRRLCGTDWVDGKASTVVEAIKALGDGADEPMIGIDAPRKPLSQLRSWNWNSRTKRWRELGPAERVCGRHCEVVVRSPGLANPQWTPRAQDAPPWMRLGFELFPALEEPGPAHEVFPSATYAQLNSCDEPEVCLSFPGFADGPKDMLDAVAAAVTVAEYAAGRGMEVGGGDGLGSIILPRSIADYPPELLRWPGKSG